MNTQHIDRDILNFNTKKKLGESACSQYNEDPGSVFVAEYKKTRAEEGKERTREEKNCHTKTILSTKDNEVLK
jgi:hypothetical protein